MGSVANQVAAAVGSKRLCALADAAVEGRPSEAQEAAGALGESGRRLRGRRPRFVERSRADYEVKVTLSST
jgi:hypothetical protein